MQYELAKMLLPIVLATGGYDSDPESVAECRETIDVQRRANEKSHTDYYVSLLGGDSHSGNTTATKRTAQVGRLSQLHHGNGTKVAGR